jgi:histone acetyltransferase HTATIP
MSHAPCATTRVACSARSFVPQTVSVGCKIYIRRPGPDGEQEERLAEILSIRERPQSRYSVRRKAAEEAADVKPEDKLEYFVHWDQFNKRLDEWVSGSRLVLNRDLEWPRPKAPPAPKKAPPQKAPKAPSKAPKAPGKAPRQTSASLLKKASLNAAWAAAPSSPAAHLSTPYGGAPSPSPAPSTPLKRKTPHDEDEEAEGEDEDAEGDADADGEPDGDADAEGDMDVDAEGEPEEETFELSLTGAPTEPPPPLASFSKEKEIEKLRTQGSMTQSISEIARVKNLNRLQIGKHEVDAWYFSPYPQEYAHLPLLYICEMCLSYFPSDFMLMRHRKRCNLLHPPGNEIYRHEDISFYELDGKRQLTYCRNLSLLSKCFLDQ